MTRENVSVGASTQQRRSSAKALFDSNGVRKAAIALLTVVHKSGRHGTLAEVLVALEVIDAAIDGRPHSMKSLSQKLGIPYTSVSRIVFSLTTRTSQNSRRLCGSRLHAMPTAMPVEPFTSRFGNFDGKTVGSCRVSS